MSRHYNQREYDSDIRGTIGTGLVFLGVAILSLFMRAFNFDFIGLSFWGFWLFIPAFFILLGSVGQFGTNKRVRQDVEDAIKARGQGRFQLETIAADAGVKRKHLLAVLIDLRAEGRISYMYDSETGDIVVGETVDYEKAPDYQPLPRRAPEAESIEKQREKNFCVFCGQKLEGNPKFCVNCGSKLD